MISNWYHLGTSNFYLNVIFVATVLLVSVGHSTFELLLGEKYFSPAS